MKIVQMEFILIQNCDGLVNRTGCYDLVIKLYMSNQYIILQKLTDTLTGFWPSENGSMPQDEPYCGFRGQRCSYTLEIVMGATLIALVLLFLVTFVIYRYW